MKVSEFDFDLPDELIATRPLAQRDASRMLVVGDKISDKHISDFVSFLQPGDVVVFNNSRVIPARFDARTADSKIYEITLHTHHQNNEWYGFAKKFNQLNIGNELSLDDGTKIIVCGKDDESGLLIEFICENVFDVLDKVGKMPLPPYMKREDDESDRDRYQTVYAEPAGSMAAPTAGLHFTPELLDAIRGAGATVVNITLHVGAGTWMPIKSDDTTGHKMHSEWGCITCEQAAIINAASRVIAVGTTSLRLLESAACLPLLEGECHAKRDEGELCHHHEKLCTQKAQSFAKKLRTKMTLYECLLWKNLRKSPEGFAFRKQHPIGKYIVDFINLEKKLIIELDGSGHLMDEQIRHDATRDKFLTDSGYQIIRFWNRQVYKEMQNVLDVIHYLLTHDDIPKLRDFYPKEFIESSSKPPLAAFGGTPPQEGGDMCTERIAPFCGTTDIFITPGYEFKAVDILLTNFHLPKSTLFMLVSAFAGLSEMKAAYAHAIAEKYRFFSYGDCCLLFRKDN